MTMAGKADVSRTAASGRQYASRLNSFKVGAPEYWPGLNRVTALELISRAATVDGLGAVDANYPDHLDGVTVRDLRARLDQHGLSLNGFAMRYYSEPAFKLGALTHPDAQIRQRAIELTKRGIDALAEAGGDLMTLWLGQDGWEVSFGADYHRLWADQAAAIAEIAAHNPAVAISLEYKPDEPRSFALLRDAATTLLMIAEIAAPNLGVTLDFAHSLYAGEMPAAAAAMIDRHSRLLGVHLNDGYGRRDDGLMVGSVHPIQTLELLYALDRIGYGNAIYFDTFPDTADVDPVAECSHNIRTIERLWAIARQLSANAELTAAVQAQDAIVTQRIVSRALLGG